MLWLLALVSASPLARAKAEYASSKEDLARARADAHLWKVRLDDARAEARVAAEAALAEQGRATGLKAKVRGQTARLSAAANATRLALEDQLSQAQAQTAELERRAEDERRLAAALAQQQPAPDTQAPEQIPRALRGLVKAAQATVLAPSSAASEVEANATALAGEAQSADAEVGAIAGADQAMERALADTVAKGQALAVAPATAEQEARRLADQVSNLTHFTPNKTAPVGGAESLREALQVPIPDAPDAQALAVLKIQLKAATETRIVDESERQAHLVAIGKLEKELAALSQASSQLAGELAPA